MSLPPIVGLYGRVYVTQEELSKAQSEAKTLAMMVSCGMEKPSVLERIAVDLLNQSGKL
jgi:hypothetical protein